MKILLLITVWLFFSQVLPSQVVVHQQHHFKKTVPAGNYSGITWLGGDTYAVVNDKSPAVGFHLMTITIDSLNGDIQHVEENRFVTQGEPNRDEEDICYVPSSNTLFICGEADGLVKEYDLEGRTTGRQLALPEVFKTAHLNFGLESLTYQESTHRFWTTTENTLKADGERPTINNKVKNRLRLQSFDDDLLPQEQYWYESDSSAVPKQKGTSHYGVTGLAALDDERLIVMERELYISPKKIGSFVQVNLYVVHPSSQQPGEVLSKELLTSFRTKMNLTRQNMANYEGICVGPKLRDGRQVLVLVADSQNQYKGLLRDWFRAIIID